MESLPDFPSGVAAVIEPLGIWWAVAGGWAIDLWLGRQTREHHDVEVVVQRDDQHLVYSALASEWALQFIDPPGTGWRTWDGRQFERPAFQAKARRPEREFDLFFEDVEQGQWVYRRDPSVRRSLDKVTATTASGIPVVRPEVQLLYMARHVEAKNRADLEAALPAFDTESRTWLRNSLVVTAPGHPWVSAIDA